MTVRVELCSFLRRDVSRYDPVEGIVVETDAGTTAEKVIEMLRIPSEHVEIVTVNRVAVKLYTVLHDGDLVGLFAMPGGG
jgi:molybdopterin converting factor small subunit